MAGSSPHGIRNRVLAVFTVSLLVFGGVLVYGIAQLRAIGESLVVVDMGYLPLSRVAANLQGVVGPNDHGYDRLAPSGPRPLEGYRESAKLYEASIADALADARAILDAAAKSTVSTAELEAIRRMRQQVDTIEVAALRYREGFEAWLAANASPPADATQATAARAEMDRRKGELRNEISELGGLIEGRIQAVSAQTLRAQNRALVMSGALALVASVMSGVLAAVALVTLRPIGLLTEQVQRLAKGDYAGRVDVSGDDEVGLLGREFNAMAGAVSERDRRLHDRAEALDRLSHRLRQVIDSIRAGLLVAEGGRVATLNPAAAKLWGIGEGDPVPPWLHALPLGRHEAVAAAGRRFDVAVVPFGDGGELIVGDDVTDRLHDRERLARSERLALVGQMLAQITHEVRNPLNAISLNAELLAEEIDDGESTAMLSVLTSEIRRLEGVTARYLDLARRRQPEHTSEDPLDIVREGAQLEREVLRRASVELRVSGTSQGRRRARRRSAPPRAAERRAERGRSGRARDRRFGRAPRRGRGGVGDGRRARDGRRPGRADLRAVLHDEGERHGPRPGDQPAGARGRRRLARVRVGAGSRQYLPRDGPHRVAAERRPRVDRIGRLCELMSVGERTPEEHASAAIWRRLEPPSTIFLGALGPLGALAVPLPAPRRQFQVTFAWTAPRRRDNLS